MSFRIKLFRSSTRSNQRMETRTSTTGNSNKQCREQEISINFPSGKSRNFKIHISFKCRKNNTHNSNQHHSIQKERRKIITRLKHNPNRNQRSNCNVKGNKNNPASSVHHKTNIQSQNNNSNNARNSNNSSRQNFYPTFICHNSINNSKQNEQNRNHSSSLIVSRISRKTKRFSRRSNLFRSRKESSGNNIHKRRNNKNQN